MHPSFKSNSSQISTAGKFILVLVSSLTVMSGATIAASLPRMAQEFSYLGNAALLSKLVLTVPALAIALAAPFAGIMIDKAGRLKVLFPALVLYAVAGCSGFFLDNLYLILAGRLFLGIAVACIMTVAITLVGDYLQGQARQKFLGIQAAFMSFGGALFVSTGGLLADISWRAPFLIYLFSIVVLMGGMAFLKEPNSKKLQAGEGQAVTKEWPKTRMILLVSFLSMIVFYMVPVQVPFYLKEIGIVENKMAGYVISLSTVASGITAFYYARFRQRFSINQAFAILFLLMGVGYGMVWLSSNYITIIAAMLIAGAGLGFLMPNLNTWLLQTVTEANRGKFSGFLSSSLFLGQFMSPLVFAPLIESRGIAFAFAVTSVLLVVWAFSFLFVANRKINTVQSK